MKETDFETAKNLEAAIEETNKKISNVEALLESVSLTFHVQGNRTPRNLRGNIIYIFNNTEDLKLLLEKEKIVLKNVLKELKQEFERL